MLIYVVVAIFSTFMMKKYELTRRKKFIILSFLSVFLVMAFRYGIGYDYLNIYTPMFNNIINSRINFSNDIGNFLLCKTIGIFTSDPFYYFFITSFIICFFMFKAILNNSSRPSLSILLFVISGLYFDSFNLVRQYMAISILLYSLKFLIRNEFKKYALYIIIASTFHNSAIIMLPLYFFLKMRLTPLKKFVFISILFVSFPFLDRIIFYLISLTKYSYYFDTSYNTINPAYSEIITSSILFVIASLFCKKAKSDKEFNIFYNYSILFFVISLLSFKIILAYRILAYFKVIAIFIVPKFIDYIKLGKDKFMVLLLFIFYFCSLTCVGGKIFGWYDMKYVSIFNKSE